MGFEELAFLFSCDNRNRGVIRMNFDEAACLWRCVQKTAGDILEIGRCRGGSTTLLLAASSPRRSVVSVDTAPAHHALAEEFFTRPENQARLTLVVGDSRTYRSGPVGLLFVDGDHSYDGVAADVRTHWPSLQGMGSRDALAVFHDAVPNEGLTYAGEPNHCPGVAKICGQLLAAGCAEAVEMAGSVLVLRKLGELPAELPDSGHDEASPPVGRGPGL